MRYIRIKTLLSAVIASVFATGCTSDDVLSEKPNGSKNIGLGVSVEQMIDAIGTRSVESPLQTVQASGCENPVFLQISDVGIIHAHENKPTETTRGQAVSNSTFYDSFQLYYYEYDATSSWTAEKSSMSPTGSITMEASKGWLTDKFWPGPSKKVAFFGYAPIDASITPSFTSGSRQITYTVPSDVASQKDILVSRKAATQDMDGDYNKVINMTFQHALTAVQFKIGSRMAPGTIKKIEVKNVHNSGTYDFDSGTWNAQSGEVTYTLTPNYDIGANRNVIFTGNLGAGSDKNDLLILMPQTLPNNAEIDVTINDGGLDRVLPISIGGTAEWKPGYTVTYSLSTSQEEGDYILSVSADPTVGYQGVTDKEIIVESYKQSYYGTKIPVGWSCTYSVDGATDSNTPGDEVTSFVSGVGDPSSISTTTTISLSKINPVSISSRNTHTATLRSATELGTAESPWNLSNQTNGGMGIENTANCYSISHPGYYCFPIVYGNAIKNGTTNAAAYTSDAAEPNTFVTHLGTQIKNPYIESSTNVTAADAVVVWQDAYNLILPKSVKIIEKNGTRFIAFQISSDFICQGNSVLAVRDANGTIMWSWHIWVTDYDIKQTNKVVNHQGTAFDMIPYEVGYCDPDALDYSETSRNIVLKFTQTASNSPKYAELLLNQAQPSDFTPLSLTMRAPYFQFGRKDPMCPIEGVSNSEVPQYNLYKQDYAFQSVGNQVQLAEAIKRPSVFFYQQSDDWNTYRSKISGAQSYNLELWDAGNVNTTSVDEIIKKVTKTVYDPSPVGFKMPATTIFTGFSSTGSVEYNPPYMKEVPAAPYYAYVIYSLDGSTQLDVTMHAFGFRDVNSVRGGTGNCLGFGNCCVLWTGGLGVYMDIWPNSVSPQHIEARAYGFAVRSVKDD